MPELPSWEAYAKAFQWSGDDNGATSVTGYDLGVEWAPFTALAVRAGVENDNTGGPGAHVLLRLSCRFDQDCARLVRPVPLTDVSSRVYDKVQRENAIRTERRRKQSTFVTVLQTIGTNAVAAATGTSGLSTGLRFAMPATVTVTAAGGSVARLGFADGGVLTLAAGTQARLEAGLVTLLAGAMHYVSGATDVTINVPGGTITLLGTDVDVTSAGGDSIVRVRDGVIRFDGTSGGSATVGVGEFARSIGGGVGTLAANAPAAVTHADTVNAAIDHIATTEASGKAAPFSNAPPRLVTDANAIGQTLVLGLPFSSAVSIAGGPPQLSLIINGNPRTATFHGGSGSTELLFSHTLQPADRRE